MVMGLPPWRSLQKKKDITLKNHHIWGYPVYALDAILQVNIAGLTKWEPCSRADLYLGHSSLYAVSVALVLNPETSHVLPQFNVVFDDEFSTVPIMMADTIPLNWTDFVKCSSQSGAPDNMDLKDSWFTPDIEEDPSDNPTQVPRVTPESNINIITSLQPVQPAQESPVNKGAPVSKAIEHPSYEGV